MNWLVINESFEAVISCFDLFCGYFHTRSCFIDGSTIIQFLPRMQTSAESPDISQEKNVSGKQLSIV